MHEAGVAGRAPFAVIVGVVACVSVFGLTMGMTYPLLALILERGGHGELAIGLNASMTPLGLIAAAWIVPRIAQALGAWRSAVVFVLATVVLLLGLGAFGSIAAWYVLRFGLGVGAGGLYIVSETWINELASERARGRVLGFYATVMSLGFASGPLLLLATGSRGWAPFLVGAAITAGSVGCVLPLRRWAPAFARDARASVRGFLPRAPLLLAAVAVFAFYDQATLSLLPIYGLVHGMDEDTVALALGVLIGGNVVLQYPIGWLADRLSARLVMVLCALGTAAASALLPWAVASPALLWPLLFVWGGVSFGLYTTALVELGRRFRGAALLAGNAAFALMWGVGGIVGAPVAGEAMESWGPEGLPATLGVLFALFAGFAALRARAR